MSEDRDDLLATLQALDEIDDHLGHRVDVWREIIAPDGTVVGRVYRYSFYQHPAPPQETDS